MTKSQKRGKKLQVIAVQSLFAKKMPSKRGEAATMLGVQMTLRTPNNSAVFRYNTKTGIKGVGSEYYFFPLLNPSD